MASKRDDGSQSAPIQKLTTNPNLNQVPDDTTILSNSYFQANTGESNFLGQKSNKNIRQYQNKTWYHHFQDLVTFIRENHCFPNQQSDQPKLFSWVKRQRCQYGLFQRGRESNMTQERIDMLNSIGFVWNQQENLWQKRFKELVDFKKKYGHCLVPYNYQENQKLTNWIKIQRRQYVLYLANNPSNMTYGRIQQLERLGFAWSNGGNKDHGHCHSHNTTNIYLAAVEFDKTHPALDKADITGDDLEVNIASDGKTRFKDTRETFQDEGSHTVGRILG